MSVEAGRVMCAVIPRQIIQWGHAEAGDDRSLPLLGKQLLPHAFLRSQRLLHLTGVEAVLTLCK